MLTAMFKLACRWGPSEAARQIGTLAVAELGTNSVQRSWPETACTDCKLGVSAINGYIQATDFWAQGIADIDAHDLFGRATCSWCLAESG